MGNTIRFILGDRLVEVDFDKNARITPTTTLLEFLRTTPGCKGTKEGCGVGDCGACTVVVAGQDHAGEFVYRAVNSCLLFLPMMHGKQVITIENLGTREGNEIRLHPVQQIMVDAHAIQCGFCTPGITMSLFGLFKNNHSPLRQDVEEALAGNLCRCTGYQAIIDGVLASEQWRLRDQFDEKMPVIAEMMRGINAQRTTISLNAGEYRYLRPATLPDALQLRRQYPEAILIGGATDAAVRKTRHGESFTSILDLSNVEELQQISEDEACYHVGAGVTLEAFRSFAHGQLDPFSGILRLFGSMQIRNLATIAGNIGSASPIGDMLPLLIACDARVHCVAEGSHREVKVEQFITGYHQTALGHDEIITGITIPKFGREYMFYASKISKREHVDIASVNAAFRIVIHEGAIADIRIVYGAMDKMVRRALKTEAFLIEKAWSRKTIEDAMTIVGQDFNPISDVRASAIFRSTAARNLLLKFFYEVARPGNFISEII